MIDGAYLFRAMAAEWMGSGTVTLSTDLPDELAEREIVALPAEGSQKSQTFPFAGTTKGRSYSVVVAAASSLILLRLAFWVKRMGIEASPWVWMEVPLIPGSGDEIIDIHIEIPPTPNDWQEAQVAIPPTSDAWNEAPVEIPPTQTDWSQVPVAIPATPDQWDERPVPVPPSPEEQQWADIPVDE